MVSGEVRNFYRFPTSCISCKPSVLISSSVCHTWTWIEINLLLLLYFFCSLFHSCNAVIENQFSFKVSFPMIRHRKFKMCHHRPAELNLKSLSLGMFPWPWKSLYTCMIFPHFHLLNNACRLISLHLSSKGRSAYSRTIFILLWWTCSNCFISY